MSAKQSNSKENSVPFLSLSRPPSQTCRELRRKHRWTCIISTLSLSLIQHPFTFTTNPWNSCIKNPDEENKKKKQPKQRRYSNSEMKTFQEFHTVILCVQRVSLGSLVISHKLIACDEINLVTSGMWSTAYEIKSIFRRGTHIPYGPLYNWL